MTTQVGAGVSLAHQFVEQEHRELGRGITSIREAADGMELTVAQDVDHRLRGVLDWFETRFKAHLAWEDAWLFPQLDGLVGTEWVGRIVRFEHEQIRCAFGELETERHGLPALPDREALRDIRARLYGLESLVRAHVEREEWLLFPVLDDESEGDCFILDAELDRQLAAQREHEIEHELAERRLLRTLKSAAVGETEGSPRAGRRDLASSGGGTVRAFAGPLPRR